MDKEAEAEQEGEHRVGLAPEGEEQPVPQGAVGEAQPGALPRRVGIGVVVEVFHRVQDDDAHHGHPPQHVGHVDACVWLQVHCAIV